MSAIRIRPYPTAAAGAVTAGGWIWSRPDGDAPVTDVITGWDPLADLVVRRTLDVDVKAIVDQCGLDDAAALTLCTLWSSSGTRRRGAGGHVTLNFRERHQVVCETTIPGADVGGRIQLKSAVVLGKSVNSALASVAIPAGAPLWEDPAPVEVGLEGTVGRFPVQIVEFGGSWLLPEHAAWSVHIGLDDPNQDPSTGLMLFINKANEDAVAAVETGSPVRDRAITSLLVADVTRQVIVRSLAAGILDDPDADPVPGSLAQTIRDLIGAVFPGDDPANLRQAVLGGEGWIDAKIQHWLKVLRWNG